MTEPQIDMQNMVVVVEVNTAGEQHVDVDVDVEFHSFLCV